MKESLNPAQEGLTAEYYRSPEQLERDKLLTLAILDNYLDIHPAHLDCYASVPVEEAFDWDEIYDKIIEEYELDIDTELHVFAFGSRPSQDRNAAELDAVDLEAYRAARKDHPDKFLYYYREGIVDNNGNVLSFCIWTNRQAARSVRNSDAHEHAAQYADSSYSKARTQWMSLNKADKGQEVVVTLSDPHSLSVGHSKGK